MNSIKLKIPSNPENIRIVESFIDNAKEKYHINEDLYGNLMVTITEAVNNAIVHGNKSDEKKSVDLQLDLEEEVIRCQVTDEGNGFDYNDLLDPTLPENIDKDTGRGIFLMKNLCDEVIFKNDGKLVELVFYVN